MKLNSQSSNIALLPKEYKYGNYSENAETIAPDPIKGRLCGAKRYAPKILKACAL
jgi:hypothetical protein